MADPIDSKLPIDKKVAAIEQMSAENLINGLHDKTKSEDVAEFLGKKDLTK